GNTIGNAATQVDLLTAPDTTTPVGTPRLTVKGNGNVGIGTQNPSYPLQMASGAYVSAGGTWTNASSRDFKEDIEALSAEEALDAVKRLHPVKFAYKTDPTEKHVGFIAEDVPDLVATKDRKGLSPLDIVAVLTKVIQERQKTISMLSKKMAELEKALDLR
ncbi:MAG: tail fiber domain-containing protein, partial [Deltaproteobacteria bacterium]